MSTPAAAKQARYLARLTGLKAEEVAIKRKNANNRAGKRARVRGRKDWATKSKEEQDEIEAAICQEYADRLQHDLTHIQKQFAEAKDSTSTSPTTHHTPTAPDPDLSLAGHWISRKIGGEGLDDVDKLRRDVQTQKAEKTLARVTRDACIKANLPVPADVLAKLDEPLITVPGGSESGSDSDFSSSSDSDSGNRSDEEQNSKDDDDVCNDSNGSMGSMGSFVVKEDTGSVGKGDSNEPARKKRKT